MSIVDDILSITDDILGLRDELGAVKHNVYLVTRRWSGSAKGDGVLTEEVVQVLPTPYVRDYSQDLRVREGGGIQQGDIVLRNISRQSYPEESMIDCSVPEEDQKTVEKYYKINEKLFQVISVTRDYVVWNVQVRKTIKR